MKDLYLILKNLTRKPLRLFLTVFATFIAFMIFGTLTALSERVRCGHRSGCRRPPRGRQQDQLHAAAADRLRQSRPGVGRRSGRDAPELVRRLLPGSAQSDGHVCRRRRELLTVYDELLISDEERAAWIGNRQGLIAGKSVAQRSVGRRATPAGQFQHLLAARRQPGLGLSTLLPSTRAPTRKRIPTASTSTTNTSTRRSPSAATSSVSSACGPAIRRSTRRLSRKSTTCSSIRRPRPKRCRRRPSTRPSSSRSAT